MSLTLMEQFIKEECTPYVRGLVLAALEAGGDGSGPSKKHFEFNRFEITLDLEEGVVLIEDVLDASDVGAQRVPIGEFSAALGSTK